MKKRMLSLLFVVTFMILGVVVVNAASKNLLSVEVNVSSSNNYSKNITSVPYAYANSAVTLLASSNTRTSTYVKISLKEGNAFAQRIGKKLTFSGEGSVVVATGYVGTGTWKYELLGSHPSTGTKYDPWTGMAMLTSNS